MMVYCRILNIVLCHIQSDLVVYPFYMEQVASASPHLPNSSSVPTPSTPLGNHTSKQTIFQSSFILTVKLSRT